MPRRAKIVRRTADAGCAIQQRVGVAVHQQDDAAGQEGPGRADRLWRAGSIAERTGRNPLEVFEQALAQRDAGDRGQAAACWWRHLSGAGADRGPRAASRWRFAGFSLSPRARSGKSMQEKLANELLDAVNGTGATIKRREDTHRMAEANRAFSHYRTSSAKLH